MQAGQKSCSKEGGDYRVESERVWRDGMGDIKVVVVSRIFIKETVAKEFFCTFIFALMRRMWVVDTSI